MIGGQTSRDGRSMRHSVSFESSGQTGCVATATQFMFLSDSSETTIRAPVPISEGISRSAPGSTDRAISRAAAPLSLA